MNFFVNFRIRLNIQSGLHCSLVMPYEKEAIRKGLEKDPNLIKKLKEKYPTVKMTIKVKFTLQVHFQSIQIHSAQS